MSTSKTGDQLALFELSHVHVFERYLGPHLVFPAMVVKQGLNEYLWRYYETEDRWCLGCGKWVRFIEGVEIPRDREAGSKGGESR